MIGISVKGVPGEQGSECEECLKILHGEQDNQGEQCEKYEQDLHQSEHIYLSATQKITEAKKSI